MCQEWSDSRDPRQPNLIEMSLNKTKHVRFESNRNPSHDSSACFDSNDQQRLKKMFNFLRTRTLADDFLFFNNRNLLSEQEEILFWFSFFAASFEFWWRKWNKAWKVSSFMCLSRLTSNRNAELKHVLTKPWPTTINSWQKFVCRYL